MKEQATGGISRREYMAAMGLAGLGAFASSTPTAWADVKAITGDRFGYSYRTFSINEKIRVAMIGTSGHTNLVLDGIGAGTNTELAGYARYDNTGVKISDGTAIFDDYETMLDRVKPDVVGICLPYSENARASIAAAERGIHIVTEKPVATTLDDLGRVLKTVTAKKVRLTAMLNMRTEPRFLAMRESIARGDIGEPVLVTSQKSYKFGDSRPDFYRREETYGGTIPWVGIHALDYMHFTTGLGYRQVTAFQGTMVHMDYPGCPDYAGVLLRTDNGGAAMVNIDFLRPAAAPTHGDDGLRVIGANGVLELKEVGQKVELITHTREPYYLDLPEQVPFFADFMKELRGQGTHIIPPQDPFEMTRVALTAHQAAKSGEIVGL